MAGEQGLERLKRHVCFGGVQEVHRHRSAVLGCAMEFALYLPPQAARGPVPLVTYLSGLTCTWENATTKAGAQRYAAEHGLALLFPDTSPRGLDLPGEHERYDFGSGAGFYVDATAEPWSANYRMFSYVTEELPALVGGAFPLDMARQGIMGHSMGGHGALVSAFRHPDRYRSVSAFSPIVAPSQVPWGRNAFTGYLGPDEAAWAAYDATALAASTAWRKPVLVDQGTGDEFLAGQLRPELLEAACATAGIPLTVRRQDGYDHSYYFIASFMGDHLAHHAAALRG
ncbi:S-formylglutathione hydrolase [Azospirillum oleiclasticum]|uniref:S-formylglutathione hydrolase n=1 Tax=Azospirillum oleiclasticum TaxID=2735135 RepID=UPI0024844512|nr:S-formylglutathione hydrolase [Azospirillum oleiclasticum]